jgi:hypothetical protein
VSSYDTYRLHCCVCGRFARWDADSSTRFGNSTELEPPEPDFFCARCEKTEEEYYVQRGWVPSNWIKANWERRAAKRLRLVEAGPKGAGWLKWIDPNYMPKDWHKIRESE